MEGGACAEAGYGLLLSMQVQPPVGSGELAALAQKSNLLVSLYWHHCEKAPLNAQAISELVMRHAREVLTQQSPVSLDD